MISDSFNNLSKLFIYENENGNRITFNYGGGFLINKPEGIDTLSVNLSQAQGIDQIGATIQSINIQPRPITINGYVIGEGQTNKDKLMSVIRPDLEGKLYADDYYVVVRPTSTPVIEPKRVGSQFQVSFLAAYPYWVKDETESESRIAVAKNFKFPWKICESYSYGTTSTRSYFNLYNSGQVPVPFTATFTAAGTVENPKVTNTLDNSYLKLNKTMVSGEVIKVEITHSKTYVTSSIDGECRGSLDLGSTFTRLQPGDNVVKPEATSGLSYLNLKMEFANEKSGITL